MNQIVDLSQPIGEGLPFTADPTLTAPEIIYSEGMIPRTRIETISGLRSDAYTHVRLAPHVAGPSPVSLPVGARPVEDFVARPVAILNVSDKAACLQPYFDSGGRLSINVRDTGGVTRFLQSAIDSLAITRQDIYEGIARNDSTLETLQGLLLYTGLGRYWQPNVRIDATEHAAFFAPYFTRDACELLVDSGLKLVGTDAPNLEHPLSLYMCNEIALVLNPTCRSMVQETQQTELLLNHRLLLCGGVLMYANLRLAPELCNHLVEFSGVPLPLQMPGACYSALVHAYARHLTDATATAE